MKGFTIPRDKLRITFFMRTKLDEDWVLHLALLIEEGQKIKPIEVRQADKDGSYEVIHGRHRIAAYELARVSKIPATIRRVAVSKVVRTAFEESVDTKAPLPLKKRDVIHSIVAMYDSGMTYGEVMQSLRKKWTYAVCKKYITDAQSNMNKRKLSQALSYYAENPDSSLPDIAKQFDLRLPTLIRAWDKNNAVPIGFPETKAVMTRAQRSLVRYIRNHLSRMRIAFTENEATQNQIEDVMDHAIYLVEDLNKVVLDEKARVASALMQH